jgi:hypothetical protein
MDENIAPPADANPSPFPHKPPDESDPERDTPLADAVNPATAWTAQQKPFPSTKSRLS